jgi:hypothetical protein
MWVRTEHLRKIYEEFNGVSPEKTKIQEYITEDITWMYKRNLRLPKISTSFVKLISKLTGDGANDFDQDYGILTWRMREWEALTALVHNGETF